MNPSVHIYKKLNSLHEAIAQSFMRASVRAQQTRTLCSIALPGGNTPRALFKYLVLPQVAQRIIWNHVQFFWGDERCVPPDHPDSNFGMAQKYMISHINIPASNVHRIFGENDLHFEPVRYSKQVRSSIKTMLDSTPRLDWVLLGLGSDGHTASLFPGQAHSGLCGIAFHPKTGQKRITMTYKLLNHAHRISFIVRGKDKARILAKILKGADKTDNIPAANIRPVAGICEWHIDVAAASCL